MGPRKRTARDDSEVSKRTKDLHTHQRTSVAGKIDNYDSRFSLHAAQAWFAKYKEPDEDVIGPTGIMQFSEDVEIPVTHINMLIIAWLAGAKRAGYFSMDEWTHVMRKLNTDSPAKLQAKRHQLAGLISDKKDLKDIFRYAFDFARDSHAKNLDIDTAKGMLSLLLEGRWALLSNFLRFLDASAYRVVNRDQWVNIYEFCTAVAPDLSNYDTNGAWPVMLDEFVEWSRANGASGSR